MVEATEDNQEAEKLDPPREHTVTLANVSWNVATFPCEKSLIIALTFWRAHVICAGRCNHSLHTDLSESLIALAIRLWENAPMNRSVIARPENKPITAEQTAMAILCALSFSHMVNDSIQSVIPSIYPLLRERFALSLSQVGFITFAFQGTASVLQPLVGTFTDRRPLPFSLTLGMGLTTGGLVLLAFAPSYAALLVAAGLIGMGSSVFHPEASRLARLASGGKHGLAQSLFQVGGNFGSSLGPLLARWFIMPNRQTHALWLCALTFLGMVVLVRVSDWYREKLRHRSHTAAKKKTAHATHHLSRRQVIVAMAVLIILIFSKYVYLASLSSYYTFYLMKRFQISAEQAQLYLFWFLFAVAAGTIIGGPVGDRIGRKYVIWISILGAAPFAWLLPEANLFWTGVLSAIVGVILASAFSAILVYAQELSPGKVGLIAGLFFGFAFGIGGIGSALLGQLADRVGIISVFGTVRYLPLLGLLTVFLPNLEKRRA
jgi:FSR family fosmidomycin resistance protein-like MFS transporter